LIGVALAPNATQAAGVNDDLAELLTQHRDAEFPTSVIKGIEYGGVDPVMIGADIYGWASRADDLSASERASLADCHDRLSGSLDAFPAEARPYYELLVRIASLALGNG
jgi:hypothetical protein